MKVFAVVTVATEIDGRVTVVKFEKAFAQAGKADEYVKSLAPKWREVIQQGNASIDCMCERGVHELDVEE